MREKSKMMPKAQPRSKRNAELTRQALLDAAEAAFAEHGFAGARVEAIAKAAGYNQGLIFRYFGDKLGLYAEVLRRIDRQGMEFQARLIQPLLEDETNITDPHRFRLYLTNGVRAMFDFMANHPRVVRMLLWEQAEGWQTYTKLPSLFKLDDLEQIKALFSKAGKADLFQSENDLFVILILAEQICWTFLSSFPFYHMILPDLDFNSGATRQRLREQIVQFIVAGILGDLKTGETE
jgi:TetR/AcrR family transcriptional regulator